MKTVVGILGVGHLAGYLVEGLRRSDPDLRLVLSPRNRERATELAARFDARVAGSNRDVAAAADVVFLATRPAQAVSAVSGLPWRVGQRVISVAAGLSQHALAPVVAPAALVRAMPLSCAAIGESPTALFPDDHLAHDVLSRLGSVFVLPDEESFQAASAIGAFYAWCFALVAEVAGWLGDAGVGEETARELVASALRGAGGMIVRRSEEPLAAVSQALFTPGGISERGLAVLRGRGALEAWREACEAALARLKGAG